MENSNFAPKICAYVDKIYAGYRANDYISTTEYYSYNKLAVKPFSANPPKILIKP